MSQTPTTPTAADGPAVTHNEADARFEIAVAGERAGFTAYVDDGDSRIFFHTEVDDAYAGQGLAAILVRQALDETRAAGLAVVPVCPYVARYVKSHHDWDDIVRPVTREAMDTVRRVTGS